MRANKLLGWEGKVTYPDSRDDKQRVNPDHSPEHWKSSHLCPRFGPWAKNTHYLNGYGPVAEEENLLLLLLIILSVYILIDPCRHAYKHISSFYVAAGLKLLT